MSFLDSDDDASSGSALARLLASRTAADPLAQVRQIIAQRLQAPADGGGLFGGDYARQMADRLAPLWMAQTDPTERAPPPPLSSPSPFGQPLTPVYFASTDSTASADAPASPQADPPPAALPQEVSPSAAQFGVEAADSQGAQQAQASAVSPGTPPMQQAVPGSSESPSNGPTAAEVVVAAPHRGWWDRHIAEPLHSEVFEPGRRLVGSLTDEAGRVWNAAHGSGPTGLDHQGRGSPEAKPIPLMDPDGQQSLNWNGEPIYKPNDVSLANVASLGEWAKTQPPLVKLSVLRNFIHNGPMDFQRRGGKFHKEYIDFATVALGVFGAAAGIDVHDLLDMQNNFATLFSNFGRTPPAPTSPRLSFSPPKLPSRNIYNTNLGYRLYERGVAQQQ